jgi:hypothetical protein
MLVGGLTRAGNCWKGKGRQRYFTSNVNGFHAGNKREDYLRDLPSSLSFGEDYLRDLQ